MPEGSRRRAVRANGPTVWLLVLVVAFALGLGSLQFGTIQAGVRRAVSFPRMPRDPMALIAASDQSWLVWGVARNAYTLINKPLRLFDAEICFPAKKSLAHGEPMIGLGLLGIPAYLATEDPVLTFNFAVSASWLLAGLAMYWLVAEWTGMPAAGVIASLYYVFDPRRLQDIVHPYIHDTTGALLALFFAQRLFRLGRWRDAVGLAVACSLQIAASFYPLLAAVTIAIPFSAWLLWRYGFRSVRVAQLTFVGACLALAAIVVLGPYIELRGAGTLARRATQVFVPLTWYLPGRRMFPGWGCLTFAAAGVLAGQLGFRNRDEGDPRFALILGGVLLALLAAGPHAATIGIPNIYNAFAALFPGLDVVRAPGSIADGGRLVIGILVGLGTGAILRLAGARLSLAARAALVLVSCLDLFRPAVLGMQPPVTYHARTVRPANNEIDFFRTLAAKGNRGPILEIPFAVPIGRHLHASVLRILRSAYHHRRTSACYTSHMPVGSRQLERIASGLPDASAFEALRNLAFTTIVVHRHAGRYPPIFGSLNREAAREDGEVRLIHRSRKMTAYEIKDAT